MIEYKVVDLVEVPQKAKWLELFGGLPFDKAIQLDLDTFDKARHQQTTIQASLRYIRRQRLGLDFIIRSRIVRIEPNLYRLFLWKQKRSSTK